MTYHDGLFKIQTLQKLAGHPEDRLRERTNLEPRVLDELRKRIKGAKIPRGTHHARLPDGSSAVLKEVGPKGHKQHVVATVLSPHMSAPGIDITAASKGIDPDEYSKHEIAEGPNQFRRAREYEKRTPTSHVQEQSSYQVKVAESEPTEYERGQSLRAVDHDMSEYLPQLEAPFQVLAIDMSSLPMVPPPENMSEQTMIDLQTIIDAMEEEPLDEDTMELADNDPIALFQFVCDELGVDAHTEMMRMVADDLKKVSLPLKVHYSRPRPQFLAPYHGVMVKPYDSDTTNTPSYPSGHALLGYVLAELYGQTYPNAAERFRQVADMLAYSRIQGGHHYPSDNAYSRLLSRRVLDITPEEEKAPVEKRASKQWHTDKPSQTRPAVSPPSDKTRRQGHRLTTRFRSTKG